MNFHFGSVGVSSRIFAVYSASIAGDVVGDCAVTTSGAASGVVSEAMNVAWRMTSAWVRGQTRYCSARERETGEVRDLSADARFRSEFARYLPCPNEVTKELLEKYADRRKIEDE